MSRPILLLISSGLALILLAAGAYLALAPASGDYALAELAVDKMTCGSCAGKVEGVLSGLAGIGEIEVSVTTGRARVEFDPALQDVEGVTGRITRAGYPARAERVLSVAEYRLLREDAGKLSGDYVGRIGEVLVSREDFAAELARFGQSPGASIPASDPGLLRAAWGELAQRRILLLSAEGNGVVVHPGEVEGEIARMRGDRSDFDDLVASRFGGSQAFRNAVREALVIQRNLEGHLFTGGEDTAQRRLRFESWYRELSRENPVTLFDPDLRAAVEGGGSGCGGSCCG